MCVNQGRLSAARGTVQGGRQKNAGDTWVGQVSWQEKPSAREGRDHPHKAMHIPAGSGKGHPPPPHTREQRTRRRQWAAVPMESRRTGLAVLTHPLLSLPPPSLSLQQFGKILDVEIIFNERGSKVGAAQRPPPLQHPAVGPARLTCEMCVSALESSEPEDP